MTTEELMKPRYKVIADWPNRKDFNVGQIITVGEAWNPGYLMYSIEDCQGKREYLQDFFDQYPHLFQRLEWWHDREEVPQYVKFIANKSKVAKLLKLYHRDMVDIEHDGKTIDCLDMELFLPATLEEYNNYIKSKP